MHSYTHTAFTRLSDAALRSELRRPSDVISRAEGGSPVCVRPPYGATNARVRRVIASEGLTQVMWNVDTLDWSGRSSAAIAAAVLKAADGKPLTILMHDGGDDWQRTAAALPTIVDGLRARGYTFGVLC
jgi:peptidoglycan-N-acetylglucosamine deacetylase